MLYILTGPDDFSRTEALEEIKQSMGDSAILSANILTLDGRQLTLEQLENVCMSIPFLSEKRLVIIEGLLARFESNGKTGRQRKTKQNKNQPNDCKTWVDRITNIPETTIAVLVDGKLSAGNALYKSLLPKAKIRQFPLLNRSSLRQWIEKRVREAGGSISPAAVETLMRLVGSNLWSINQEIDKLSLYALGRKIEEADIQMVVGGAQELNVFNMIDAIFEVKPGVAGRALEQLLERGVSPAYLMVMVARQVRLIARIKELQHQRKSEADIQNKVGLTLDFIFRKTLDQANRYSMERIKEVYRRILETDVMIKTGSYDGELALNILIADLCPVA